MKEKDHNHRDEIEQVLQATFSEYRPLADDRVWQNIEEALHRKEKKRAVVWWLRGAAAASVAVAIALTYFISTPHTAQDTSVVGTQPTGADATNKDQSQTPPIPSENSVAAGEETYDKRPAADGDPNETPQTPPAGAETAVTVPEGGLALQPAGNTMLPSPLPAIEAGPIEKMSLLALAGPFANTAEPEVKKRFFPIDPSEYAVPGGKGGSWELAANFSSAGSRNSATSATQSNSLRNDGLSIYNNEKPEESEMTSVTYHAPVIVGLRGGIDLSVRLSMESGVSYTLLPSSSEGMTPAGEHISYRTELHYLGVPLMLNYRFVMRQRFNVYCTQGFTFDKGIAGRRSSVIAQSDPATRRFANVGAPGLQGAIVLGVGVDYHLTRVLGIYFQPSISSWLLNLGQGPNGRNEQLIWPNAQIGLRFRP